MVDVRHLHPGVGKHLGEGLAAPVEKVAGHLFKVGAGEHLVEVHRPSVGGHGQVLHGDGGLHGARELLFGLLGGFLEPLEGDLVLGEVDSVLALDNPYEPVDYPLVPVVSAQVVVAVGGLDLDGGETVLVLSDFEQGYVEGAAAQVEYEDLLVFVALLEAVGEGGRGGLVYNP